MPDASPEVGENSQSHAAGRIELIGQCACIVGVIAAVLVDAPFWIGQQLIAWGWV